MVALKGPQNVLKKESLQNYFPPPSILDFLQYSNTEMTLKV